MAILYFAKGDYTKAEERQSQALKILQHSLGLNHPKTAHCIFGKSVLS
jgi:hypothetical protein